MRFGYSAFGLTITSQIELPELKILEGSAPADVQICLGRVDEPPPEAFSLTRWIRAEDNTVLVFWPDVGSFRISDGREIVVDPVVDTDPAVLRLFLLGTVLAILLHQRSLAVFHAAAVAVNGAGVVLAGKKGAGKSSLASAIHSMGHRLLSDDLAVVDLDREPCLLCSGFPHLKLWPDSAETLYEGKTLKPLRAESRKLGLLLEDFDLSPVPLRTVVLLDQGDDLRLETVPHQPAAIELMGHWYGARFGKSLFESLGAIAHLRHCARICQIAKIYRFYRPNRISDLISQSRFLCERLSE